MICMSTIRGLVAACLPKRATQSASTRDRAGALIKGLLGVAMWQMHAVFQMRHVVCKHFKQQAAATAVADSSFDV